MKRLTVEYHDKIVNMSLPGAGNMSAILTVVDGSDVRPGDDDDVFLSLGGLDSTTGRHVRWGHVDLEPGDIVRITVHDDQESDPPTSYIERDNGDHLESKREQVRSMAAELGWIINE
jgi:hypothetical protein